MQSALPPWGPFWDHTSCAMLHDLPVCERPARPIPGQTTLLPAKTCHRYLLGVKWSQVQILSARPEVSRHFWSSGSGPKSSLTQTSDPNPVLTIPKIYLLGAVFAGQPWCVKHYRGAAVTGNGLMMPVPKTVR